MFKIYWLAEFYLFLPNVDKNANYISCKSKGDALNTSRLPKRVRLQRIAARQQYELLCIMTTGS